MASGRNGKRMEFIYMRKSILFFSCLAIALGSCQSKKVAENRVMIFCASSLTPVVEEIKQQWEEKYSAQVIINSASSGTLARQIENGAHADLFLSASPEWMEYIMQSMKLKSRPKTIASNKLVVIAPIDTKLDSMDFNAFLKVMRTQQSKIALADPGHVPLGKYTKESMDFYHIYDQLSSRFILTKDARSTLRLVELGEAALGFVYYSDAITSDKVIVVSEVAEESHIPIHYQSIVINNGNPAVAAFYKLLFTQESLAIWKSHGFSQ